MSWSIGYDDRWKRDIGYGVPAICDHPKCDKKIDRGISYVCGGEAYGGDHGCGLYFCESHLYFHNFVDGNNRQVCFRCDHYNESYKPKPDVAEWVKFKETDPSWKEWRDQNIQVTP